MPVRSRTADEVGEALPGVIIARLPTELDFSLKRCADRFSEFHSDFPLADAVSQPLA